MGKTAQDQYVTLQNVALKCRNFKCFGDDPPQGFDRIKPINIIIGRNNSGKSTLLDLVEHVVTHNDIIQLGHKGGGPPVALIDFELTRELLLALDRGKVSVEDGRIQRTVDRRDWAFGKLCGCRCTVNIDQTGKTAFVECTFEPGDSLDRKLVDTILARLNVESPFEPFSFCRVAAERNVAPETPSKLDSLPIKPNGNGVTNVILRHIVDEGLNEDLVEMQLLDAINSILHPDACYTRLFVLLREAGNWEIHLSEPAKGRRIPLSQTGSGLKTILHVLANLIVVPQINGQKALSQHLFAFEELENNLHPAIQRRLFGYLRDQAVAHGCFFFITTHSNVVIDLFSGDDQAQILHVTHDGERATVHTVETSHHGYSVLDDLDVRASDLLQTNAVVWVEGPSDAIYFAKWVNLWSDGELVEGIHFQCLPYGGSVSAHLSFESPEDVDDFIAALRINHHAIFLADSDKQREDDALKPHVERLTRELTEVGGYAWITEGKEVENYIPPAVFPNLLGKPVLETPGKYEDVLEYIKMQKDKETRERKVDLAHDVSKELTKDLLENMQSDLASRLADVVKLVRAWNQLQEKTPASSNQTTRGCPQQSPAVAEKEPPAGLR